MPTLKMPMQRAVCEELLHLLEHGELTQERKPSVALLAAIDAAVDMLGVPELKNPLLQRSSFMADLYQISPAWWRVHRDEQACMLGTDAEASDRALVRISDHLASITGYDSRLATNKDARWLFEKLPPLLDQSWDDIKVFEDHPSREMESSLPPVVMAILHRHPTCLAVAGGAVLGAVSRFAEYGSDVDLFIYGEPLSTGSPTPAPPWHA